VFTSNHELIQMTPEEVINFLKGSFAFWNGENGKYIIIKKDDECRAIYYDFVYRKVNYIHWKVDFEYLDKDDYSDKSRLLWELFNSGTSIDGSYILYNSFNEKTVLYNLLKHMTSKVICTTHEHSGVDYGIVYPEKCINIAFEIESDKSCLVLNREVTVDVKTKKRYLRSYLHTYSTIDRYLEIDKAMNDHPSSMYKNINKEEITFDEVLSRYSSIQL